MPGAFLFNNLVPGAASVVVNPDPLGGLSAATPVSNLLDPQPRLRVRTILSPAFMRVLVDFGRARSLDCVAAISSTAGSTATVRVRLSMSDPTGIAGEIWDTGLAGAADTGPDANGNIVVVRAGGVVSGQYLLVDIVDGTQDLFDLGLLVAGELWRLSRAQSYGFREGRLMLDQRERNAFTGAEFPVPALFNPRFAAFAVQNLGSTEIRTQQRTMLRLLGAVQDALWIPDLSLSRFEMNRRAIWGAAAQPGDDAGPERVKFIGWLQAWRLVERG
jgi:hypothetical protein